MAAPRIDALLEAAWAKAGVVPAPLADDETFVRRAYLDVTGVIPPPEAVTAFVADKTSGKRDALVARLLGGPGYVRHWTERWDDVLMGPYERDKVVDRVAFRAWLADQLARNVGYDEIVRALIAGQGRNSTGGKPDRVAIASGAIPAPAAGVNGAVNWVLSRLPQPQDLSGATARMFLGVQVQCAECHDHPTEKWKQEDFRRFTAVFMRTVPSPVDKGKVEGIRVVDLTDVDRLPPRQRTKMKKTGYTDERPAALDGTDLSAATNRREALARWSTSPENPWFTRAIVNRMWAALLGRGFIEPIDDLRAGSEVAAPEVLAVLEEEMRAGYDLRRLIRTIMATAAYQRATTPAAGDTSKEPVAWHRFQLRPMSATQLLDSVVAASELEPVFEEVVGERITQVKARLRSDVTFTFDVDEESANEAFTGTVPQALMLQNGALVAAASTTLEGSRLAHARALPTPARIEALYLAALSRKPSPDEVTYWTGYVAQRVGAVPARSPKPPAAPRDGGALARVHQRLRVKGHDATDVAFEDLFWALLNSNELFFIH